jgi:SPOR domain
VKEDAMGREGRVPVFIPELGNEGETCAQCGAPLASDQRYCLNCGYRRAETRLPFLGIHRDQTAATRTEVVPTRRRELSALWLVVASAAAFALVLGLGILIGSLGDGGKQVVASRPQVITVAAPATGTTTAAVSFTSDWPDGKDGFTVQLRTLPNDTTQPQAVDAAKSAARSNGAIAVGALDSDDFSSLDSGNYVVYSGVYDSRKQAKKALSKLKRDFPAARVIHVAAGGGIAAKGDPNALSGHKKEATVGKNQLKQLQKLSPSQYQKKSSKLPDTTKLPGKAPSKDKKKPGGGKGGAQVIG